MNLTIKAILARNNGNFAQSIAYCKRMARDYAHLRAEYRYCVLALRCTQLLGD